MVVGKFETTDALCRRVVLEPARWEHISTFHSIVKQQVVQYTIEQPELIVTSNKRPSDDVYFTLGRDHDHPNLYCKVVVDFGGLPGKIRTAMYQDDLHGAQILGGIKYGPARR